MLYLNKKRGITPEMKNAEAEGVNLRRIMRFLFFKKNLKFEEFSLKKD